MLQWNLLAVNVNGAFWCEIWMSSPQNPLIQPTVGPESSGRVSPTLLQGLGQIVTEDTNNILVQVLNMIFYIT